MTQQVCNTCGKPADRPYRVYNKYGKVIQGCVDGFHTGHLILGESLFWHNRKEAKKIRAAKEKFTEDRR